VKANNEFFNAARKPRGIVFISKRMTRLQRFKDYLKRKTERKKKFLVKVKMSMNYRSVFSEEFVKAYGRNDAKRRAIAQAKKNLQVGVKAIKRY
jgi:hypothetical protein